MKNITTAKKYLNSNNSNIKEICWSDHALSYFINKFKLKLVQDTKNHINYYYSENYNRELIIAFDNEAGTNKQWLQVTD